MTKVYVAAGHGKAYPGGGYDPGAVASGHIEEKLNEQVVAATASALRRNGFVVLADKTSEQYNYVEAVKVANDWHANYAMEIHHNIVSGGGSMALVADPVSDSTRAAAANIVARLCQALGTRNLGVVSRTREYFNRETTMPSCLVETCALDGDDARIDKPGYATRAGEAIAHGVCDHFKVPWHPPTPPELRQAFPLGRGVLVREPGKPEVWLVAHVLNPTDLVLVQDLLKKAGLPTAVRDVSSVPKP